MTLWAVQELQAKEMADTEGLLMESWPDEAGEGLLASAMRAVVPINSQSDFPDGAVVVEQGQPAYGLFKVEEGQVEIKTVDDYYTDSDNEEVASSPSNPSSQLPISIL